MARKTFINEVHLFRQEVYDADEICEKIVGVLISSKKDVESSRVYLAPEWSSADNREGANTHPAIVAGAAMAFHRMGANVTIGENLLPGVALARRMLPPSLRKQIDDCAVIRPYSPRDYTTVKLRGPMITKEFRLPREWFKADVAVALPKMKTNLFCDVGTSSWCILGLMSDAERKPVLDDLLSMKMADLTRLRPPDVVIVDGVIAGEGQGPLNPSPVSMNTLAIGGAVSTEAVCSWMMGIDPYYVDHLRFLAEKGVGNVDVNAITVKGRELMTQRNFKRASWFIENIDERIKVHGGAAKFCPSGCVGIIRQALDSLGDVVSLPDSREIHIVVGEPVDMESFPAGPGTVVVGDCVSHFMSRGAFVPGRPPDMRELELALYRALRGGLPRGAEFKLRLLRKLRAPFGFVPIALGISTPRNWDGVELKRNVLRKLLVSHLASAAVDYFGRLLRGEIKRHKKR